MGGLNSKADSQASSILNQYDNLLDYLSYYLFPLSIRIGMTPVQFWEEDTELFWVYLEAYEQEQKAKFEYDNNVAFLQGQYFMMAIAQCLQFSKHPKQIYPKKPFDVGRNEISPEVKAMQQEEIRKAEMKARCEQFAKYRRNKNG